MTDENAPNPNRKGRAIKRSVIAAVFIGLIVAALVYLNSSSFRELVRARVVTELENMTGGRVEIGSLQWSLRNLEVDVRDLTIHGNEGPDQLPYAHADRLLIRAQILSFFERQVALRWLQIERPVIHIIVYPDGRTNQPTPKAVIRNSQDPVQQLFSLGIRHAEINKGELLVNEHRLPLDLSVEGLQATMNHVAKENRFDGKVSFDSLNAAYAKFMPANARAELQFALFQNQLELTGFHLVSGDSSLDASGKLTNFLSPQVEVAYRATINGAELGKITRTPEIRRGIFNAQGNAHYDTHAFFSKGKLVVHDLEYRSSEAHLSKLDAAADFDLDRRDVKFSHVVSRVMGGIVRGDITVANWSGAPDASGQPSPPQSGIARLKVDSLPVGTLADAFSTKRLDFGALHLAGTARGTVDARWKDSPSRAVAEMKLEVTPPEKIIDTDLPVTAELSGRFDLATGRLMLNPLKASLPMLTLEANGVLGSAKEDLNLSLTVSDLSRVRPMLVMVNHQNTAAGELSGSMSFNGTMRGKLTSPALAGHIHVSDFVFPAAVVYSALPKDMLPDHPQLQRMRVDEASGDLAYSPQSFSVHNGVLRRAGTQANVDLTAGLINGNIVDNSPVQGSLTIRKAALADLQHFAGYNYPLSGTVSAEAHLAGSLQNPQGTGHLEIENASVYGEPFKIASADVAIHGNDASLENVLVVHNGARITGSGSYNLKSTAFRFQTVGSNFQLATIKRLTSQRATLSGLLNFNGTGSGTLSAPVINGSALLQNVSVNGQRVGDGNLTVITQDGALKLTGRSNFRDAEVAIDGTIKIHEALMPANVMARFDNFNFVPFLQPALPFKMTGTSYMGGTITLQGPLRHPKDLAIVASIPTLNAELQGIKISNPEPIQISLANEIVRVDSFHLVGTDTELTARGSADLNETQRLRLRVNGRLNLKLAELIDPDVNSAGSVDFNVAVGGVITHPDLQGELRVANGALSLIDFPNGLSNIDGTLVFTEDRVQVQSLKAHTGGGDIQIGGSITYRPQLAFNLTAKGQDIRMRYPQGVSSAGNLDLRLTGSLSNSNLTGDVTITRFGFNSQFDLAVYIAKSNRPTQAPQVSGISNLHLNIHVVSTPELQVQSSVAKVSGNVDLRIRGSAVNPVVLGRVNFTEGELTLNGQKYTLQRGDVSFNNPVHTEPNIDAEVVARVRDYDVTLGVHGPVSHLTTNYRSDPPLPQADIINLLAFGQTREETELAATSSNPAFTDTVSNAVLGQAINSAVSSRVQRLFGVSRIKIAPELGGSTTSTNPTAQVTIEQTVSNKVTITYVSNLAQSSQQSIFVEYNVTPTVSVIAGRDQYGVVSFDVRVRQRRR